jgi:hypothetical protein
MTVRRIGALALAALALWPAAPAAAKFVPVRSARMCGATGCASLSAPMVAHMLSGVEGGAMGSPVVGPYYRLWIRPHDGPTRYFYLPSTRTLDVNGLPARVSRAVATHIRAELGARQPFAPRIASVSVGAQRVADPQAYVPLLYGTSVSPPITVWNHRDIQIGIDVAGETPWSGWGSAEYFPSERLLHVPDGVWVRVSDAQAAMIAADLHPAARASGRSGTGVAIVGAAALLVAAAAGLALHRRRRPWRRPQAV